MSPDKIEITPKITDIRSLKPYHAHVYIEPLERGFGHTLGSALRRVMMSSIPGFAVTEVKIDGVIHEYDRIKGMSEDVVRFLLNLKGVVFNMSSDEKATVHLKCAGPRTVTAVDIQCPAHVEIVNKDHHLATLSAGTKLEVEIVVEKGIGYEATANRESKEGRRFGVIYLDAMFSPVRRVAFSVESARAGGRTDLDKLILDVETNGAYEFEEIIQHAATVLVEQLGVFTSIEKDKITDAVTGTGEDLQTSHPILFNSVDTMEQLSVRSRNCLHKINIRYIGELVQQQEKDLMKTPHLGRKSLVEIKQVLSEMGLQLGMALPDWVSPR